MPESIFLPDELYAQLKKIADISEKTVDALCEDILMKSLQNQKPSEQAYSKEDEEKVKDRLRNLGYLD